MEVMDQFRQTELYQEGQKDHHDLSERDRRILKLYTRRNDRVIRVIRMIRELEI